MGAPPCSCNAQGLLIHCVIFLFTVFTVCLDPTHTQRKPHKDREVVCSVSILSPQLRVVQAGSTFSVCNHHWVTYMGWPDSRKSQGLGVGAGAQRGLATMSGQQGGHLPRRHPFFPIFCWMLILYFIFFKVLVFLFFVFNMDHFLSVHCICYNIASVLCFGFLTMRHVGILAPQPGTEPTPSALKAQVPATGLGFFTSLSQCLWFSATVFHHRPVLHHILTSALALFWGSLLIGSTKLPGWKEQHLHFQFGTDAMLQGRLLP